MANFSFSDYFSIKHNTKAIFVRTGTRFAALDGLRAISIIMVVSFHCLYIFLSTQMKEPAFRAYHDTLPLILNWIPVGSFGVDVFFVLSGFFIGHILLSEYQKNVSLNIKRFYIRRLLRLYPV